MGYELTIDCKKKKILLGGERVMRQSGAIISISSNCNIDVSKNGDVEYK